MAMDSAQKRMSAVYAACPWRGPLVAAAESGTTQGNRQAAAFLYSGILASGAATFRPAWVTPSTVISPKWVAE